MESDGSSTGDSDYFICIGFIGVEAKAIALIFADEVYNDF